MTFSLIKRLIILVLNSMMPLCTSKMTILKVKNKVSLNASVKNFREAILTCIKKGTINNKIIYKHLHATLINQKIYSPCTFGRCQERCIGQMAS